MYTINKYSKDLPSIKLLMLGEFDAGKTCLLSYFTGQPVTHTSPTIGVDLVCTEVKIGDVSFKAKIWDTAGTEKYRSMNRNFYKGTVGVILVFDISRGITSQQIEEWEEEMSHISKKPSVVVVGNKVDLEVNKESCETLQKYCNEHKYTYIQTSAKEGTNVTQAFSDLLESIHEKQSIRKLLKKSSESFVLSIATNNDGCSGARISQGACEC